MFKSFFSLYSWNLELLKLFFSIYMVVNILHHRTSLLVTCVNACVCVCACVCYCTQKQTLYLQVNHLVPATTGGKWVMVMRSLHTGMNEHQSGLILSHVQACWRWCSRDTAGVLMLLMLRPTYLLDVIVQCDDFQGRGQIRAAWDGCTHRRGLTHVSLIGGELEVRRLVVLIQDLDDEVGVGREGVSVVLLSLKTQCRLPISCLKISQTLTEMWGKLLQLLQFLQWLISLCHLIQLINWFNLIGGHLGLNSSYQST